MTTRQRFQRAMNFKSFDRMPVIEWASWWDKTLQRWRSEGLSGELMDRYALYRHFGLDIYYQDWIGPAVPPAPSHGAAVITSKAQYEQLRPSLYAGGRVDHAKWNAWARQQHSGDAVAWLTLLGAFWFPRTLFGIEQHLYAFYDQPELMHCMNQDLLEFNLRVIDEVCAITTPDFVTIAEDMSYNHGSMLSRELFEQFLAPFYRSLVPELHRRGILVIVDSDGDISMPTAWFRDVGVDGLLPLERQAGVDINSMRACYPTMRFIGHFDKMVMPHGEQAMRAEFERLLPAMAGGGFIASVDHQTPPGVSYSQYQTYVRLLTEYAQRAGEMSANRLSHSDQA